MTKSIARERPSLLERAAELYDFSSGERIDLAPPVPAPASAPAPAEELMLEQLAPEPVPAAAPVSAPAPPPRSKVPASPRHQAVRTGGATLSIDTVALAEAGFIVPETAGSATAEEFRIVKRQLLLGVAAKKDLEPARRQSIMICSPQAGDGKTFCAINLALSLATEKDIEVLLIDGDFNKPEILSILGVTPGPGLIDAVLDPGIDPNNLVMRTGLGGLSLLAAGAQADHVTELLASARTAEVLDALVRPHPNRILVFDSPPALLASPATVLASQVGQVMMVVRADRTTEADLNEAVALLSGCDSVSLLLNGAGFAASGRRFGNYYGYGQ